MGGARIGENVLNHHGVMPQRLYLSSGRSCPIAWGGILDRITRAAARSRSARGGNAGFAGAEHPSLGPGVRTLRQGSWGPRYRAVAGQRPARRQHPRAQQLDPRRAVRSDPAPATEPGTWEQLTTSPPGRVGIAVANV